MAKKAKTLEVAPRKKRKYTKRKGVRRGRPPGKATRLKGSIGEGRSEPVTLHGIVGAAVELMHGLSKERQDFVLEQIKQHLAAPK